MKHSLASIIMLYLALINCANKEDYENPLDSSTQSGLLAGNLISIVGFRPTATTTVSRGPRISAELVAGNRDSSGLELDGQGTNARFSSIVAYCLDPSESTLAVFSYSSGANSYRKVVQGNVSTQVFSGSTIPTIFSSNCIFDSLGNIYIAGVTSGSINGIRMTNNGIYRISTSNIASRFAGFTKGNNTGSGLGAYFSSISHLTLDTNGDILVFDSGNKNIKKVTIVGADVTLFSGNGLPGTTNGISSSTTFNPFATSEDSGLGPLSFLAFDSSEGMLYFFDTTGQELRSLNRSNGSTSSVLNRDQLNSIFPSSFGCGTDLPPFSRPIDKLVISLFKQISFYIHLVSSSLRKNVDVHCCNRFGIV